MSGPITITYVPEWRQEWWSADVPSRTAWLVSCAGHDWLGKDSSGDPQGYAEPVARRVVTTHQNAYHGDGELLTEQRDISFGDMGSVSIVFNIRWWELSEDQFGRLKEIVKEIGALKDSAAHDPVTCRDGDHYGQCSGVTP